MTANKKYEYWLAALQPLQNRKKQMLLRHFGEAGAVFDAPGDALLSTGMLSGEETCRIRESADPERLERSWEAFQKTGIRMTVQGNPDYPEQLRNIPDGPFALFYSGTLPDKERCVAVIGARECSEYGRYLAKEFGTVLGAAGITVISGMARGIDGIGQTACIRAGGRSCGVLGCGVDICYPKENRSLYESLPEHGSILSEYPPGTPPLPQFFPARNRIISGMADELLVIEAREKSGTLITVDMALEQGKNVYAVPGRVTDALSHGCNSLISQGAAVALSPGAFLKELGEGKGMKFTATGESGKENMQEEEKMVCQLVDFTPLSTQELLDKLPEHFNFSGLQRILTDLEIAGQIRRIGGKYVRCGG